MEAVSRWLYSFVAYKDVEVCRQTQTVSCGENVLLCSIVLTDPKSTFEGYYEDKVSVLYHGENAEAAAGDCEVKLNLVSSRRLDVYCTARRAGRAKVKLDLGKWFYFADQEINFDILPSSPHSLKYQFYCCEMPAAKEHRAEIGRGTLYCETNAKFRADSTIDENFFADPTTTYRKQWSILEARIADRFGNFVPTNDYNVGLTLFNDTSEKMAMEYKDVGIEDGRRRVRVKINDAGKHTLLITLTSKTNPAMMFNFKEIQIDVKNAPFCFERSGLHYPSTCVAGKTFQVEIFPLDIFGCPFPANITTDYNLTAQISKYTVQMNGNEETIDLKVIKNESNVVIYFSVVLTKVGSRKVVIFDKDNNSKKINFEVKPDENDVHWDIATTPTKIAYRNDKLILTVRFLDCFDNEVLIDSSENIPDILKLAGPDGVHVAGKSMEKNIGKIEYHFKQSGKYNLCLADNNGDNLDGTSFAITVVDAPFDKRRSSITWLPRYDDIPDQPVFPEDESFRCSLKLKDVLGCNYDRNIPKECFEMRYGKVKVKNITVTSSADESGSYVVVVPLLNLVGCDPSPKFWFFVNNVKIENPLVLPTFQGFQQYNDEDCFVMRTRKSIVCRHVHRSDIIGNDYCHLNNIKRVCELYEDPEVFECFRVVDDGGVDGVDQFISTIIKFARDEIEHQLEKCRNILLHLLRAINYREEAFDADKARENWKDRARESYMKKEGDRPHFCSQIKEKYAKLMRRYHDVACEEFFQFYNAERDQSEIDLHGLLVVDEKKLQGYKRQLSDRGRLPNAEVERKIEEERDHGNEAVRKLRERLDNYDHQLALNKGEPWLEIIVGSGHHSKVRQQIRPKVEVYLREKRKLKFRPVNKGALVVTFKEYSGDEPCFGEYYCIECDNRWRNGRSYIGYWQACYKCYTKRNSHVECLPLKQRKRRKRQFYNPKIVSTPQEPIPHLQDLCGKCLELGHLCQSAPY